MESNKGNTSTRPTFRDVVDVWEDDDDDDNDGLIL